MKTELAQDFEYRDELSIKKDHDSLLLMSIVFSLPLIGIILLILVIAIEFIVRLLRTTRLLLLTFKHLLWKRTKNLI